MEALGGGLKNIDWTSASLQNYEENLYSEDKRVTAGTDHRVEEYRTQHQMKVCFLLLLV